LGGGRRPARKRASSDPTPKKLPNKAAGEAPAAAEVVEGRRQAKGNAVAARMSRRTSRAYDVGTALDGIRQTAKGRRDAKFTNLLFHIYAPERLRAAYYALRRDAAAGVDGGRPGSRTGRRWRRTFWICPTGWPEGATAPSL
jgi:hypothetical protein